MNAAMQSWTFREALLQTNIVAVDISNLISLILSAVKHLASFNKMSMCYCAQECKHLQDYFQI